MRNPFYLFKLFGSLIQLTRNLENLDYILDMHDDIMKLGKKDEIKLVIDQVRREPMVAKAFEHRYRFPRKNGEAFIHFPLGTLGREYGEFLLRNKISPASFPDHAIKNDADYLVMHLYETHDLWHVLTGYETNIEEELELQAFYASHTPGFLPIFIWIAALLNTVFFSKDMKDSRFEALIRGWQRGKKAKNLVGVDWVQYLSQPVSEVRTKFQLNWPKSMAYSSPSTEAFA